MPPWPKDWLNRHEPSIFCSNNPYHMDWYSMGITWDNHGKPQFTHIFPNPSQKNILKSSWNHRISWITKGSLKKYRNMNHRHVFTTWITTLYNHHIHQPSVHHGPSTRPCALKLSSTPPWIHQVPVASKAAAWYARPGEVAGATRCHREVPTCNFQRSLQTPQFYQGLQIYGGFIWSYAA